MTESEKFRTERLVARPWQIEDLPLAMELRGDPAVTALIDSRCKCNGLSGQGADGRLRGTDGSNRLSSTGESANSRSRASSQCGRAVQQHVPGVSFAIASADLPQSE